MSTLFRHSALIALVVAGCARAVEAPLHPSPAPPPDVDIQESAPGRQWTKVTIAGPYGSFEMAIPVLRISSPGSYTLSIDSVALHEVERRLLARIARVARAEAAFLMRDTSATRMSTRNPAPTIKPGLLGAIALAPGAIEPSAEGQERLKAVAQLALQLTGPIEIVALADGTASAIVDVAIARARRIYLDLLAYQPQLAEREVKITVRSVATLPGAPLPVPVVEVYVSDQ